MATIDYVHHQKNKIKKLTVPLNQRIFFSFIKSYQSIYELLNSSHGSPTILRTTDVEMNAKKVIISLMQKIFVDFPVPLLGALYFVIVSVISSHRLRVACSVSCIKVAGGCCRNHASFHTFRADPADLSDFFNQNSKNVSTRVILFHSGVGFSLNFTNIFEVPSHAFICFASCINLKAKDTVSRPKYLPLIPVGLSRYFQPN